MLWDVVYIGSQVICSFMVSLCQTLPINESGKSTIRRSTRPKKARACEETKGLGLLLALEPRIMFDGAALVTGAEIIQDQGTQDIDLQGIDADIAPETFSDPFTNSVDLLASLSTTTAPSDRKEIVFIDTSVDDYQILLAGLDPSAEAILLDSSRDGVEQMAEALNGRTDIDAIHLISHGNQGELYLGTGTLSMSSMQSIYADELTIINHALTDEADFLIYGCNFGEGETGKEAALLLAKLTGADIAASDDLTGSPDLSGDWDLEYATGAIETSIALNKQAQRSFASVLANVTVTTFNDLNDGGDTSDIASLIATPGTDGISLREAIIASNNNAGQADDIFLSAGTYTVALTGTGDTGGDLDIKDDVTIHGASAAGTIIDGGGIDRVFEILNNSSATITDVTIQNGINTNGGGILVENNTTLNLSDAVLTGNTNNGSGATGGGGAIHVHGTANLDRVLLSGNNADTGGAIGFHGANGGSLANVTISGNTATGNGGGIWTDSAITVTNSTFTLNNGDTGGGISTNGATVTISNTIVSDNTATSTSHNDVHGMFSSNGFNLVKDPGLTGDFGSDITGGSANLAGLADNGGSTETHALLSGSLAMNAGANQAAPTIDARNTSRDEIPDIGAYESTTAASKLYWAESGGNAIYRSNTDGSAKQQILSGLDSPTGLDVDVADGKIYWIESATNSLHRADLDGSNLEDLDTSSLVAPAYLGLDLVNSHIYVADNGGGVDDAIRRFNLDGSGFTTIVNNISGSPVDVAVDPIGAKIYYTNFRIALTGEILSADIGGGSPSAVVTNEVGTSSIAIDRVGGKMYWTDNGITTSKRIRAADLDGSSKLSIQDSGLLSPAGIALDLVENKVYWSDKSSNFIRRSDLDGNLDEDVITGLNSPQELAVIRIGANLNAPVNTVPGAQVVAEDTPLNILGLSVNDVDGNLSTVQVAVSNGTLTVTVSGGATISAGANGTSTLTLNGTEMDINATLASLSYQGNLHYNGPDTLTVTSTDGNSATDVDTVDITVNAVNDTPVNTVPGAQVVAEDTPLNIPGLSVNDVDGNLSTVQVAVSNGTLTVTVSGGATISAGANGTSTLTLNGTELAINATLASLSYQGNLHYNGPDTLTVTSTDGNSATDVDMVAITVNAANDAPVNTVPGAQVVAEDTPLNIPGLSVNDVDGNLSTVQVAVSNGTLTVTVSGGATISAGVNGTSTLTLSGTEMAINATLASLSYQGNLHYNGPDTLTVTSTDGNSATDVDMVAITVNAANDTPIAVADGFTVSEGSINTLDLALNDSDSDDGLDLTSIAILSGPTNGTISQINTNGTVDYTHNSSETLTDDFTYTINDLGGNTSNSATVNLTVTPQNDAPIIISDGGGASASVIVLTGNTAVTAVSATDAEGSALTYSIMGGDDAGLFSIDSSTGALTFTTAPHIQAPDDVDGNNIYEVIVQASDGLLNDTQTLAVTVTDVSVVVLPPTPDPPSDPNPPPDDDGDTGESEEEGSENVVNTVTSPQGNVFDGAQNSTGKDTKDSNGTTNLTENALAAMHQQAENKSRSHAMSEVWGLLQKSFDSTTLKSEIQSLLARSEFLKDLDRVRDAFQGVSNIEKTYLASSIAASSGLSVGYVIWLLRSGVLLTALLSSVPAWQFVNPLLILDTPVKKKRGKGQKDLEDDSVEVMFENQTRPTETSDTKTANKPQAGGSRWTRRSSQ